MEYILDLHTHTIASGHAYSTIKEMAQAASQKGIELLGITDHSMTMPGTCHFFYFQNLRVVPKKQYGVELMFGSELNIIDYQGNVDLKRWLQKRLDYGIASIHDLCYEIGTKEENTAALIGAMENPYVQIIGHPDNSRIPLDYESLVKAAKEHHVLLEVNNSSLKPGSPRPGARENYYTMLKLCRRYNTAVILGSDSHCAADAGCHEQAAALLAEVDFPEELVVNRSLKALGEYLECVR